jgi:cytochrome c biogenesis protein CcdA
MLSVFHYVVAGLTALFSLIPLVHLAIGIGILRGAFEDAKNANPPPEFIGWILVFFASGVIILGMTLAVCIASAGRKLSRQTGHFYCLVVAGIECAFMPLGTILGVFTILVLMRPSVKKLFGVPADGQVLKSE